MKLQNKLVANQSGTSSLSMQDLSMEMQETMTGGDGTCASCSVDYLLLEDYDKADDPSGDGVVNIRFMGK